MEKAPRPVDRPRLIGVSARQCLLIERKYSLIVPSILDNKIKILVTSEPDRSLNISNRSGSYRVVRDCRARQHRSLVVPIAFG